MVALTGSANIDMRSLFVNFEIAQLHYSQKDLQQLQRWATEIERSCIPYEAAIRDGTIMPKRLTQHLAHLVSPLL